MVVPAAAEDAAVALLWEKGTLGIEVQAGPSGAVTLLGYFEERTALERELSDALAAFDGASVEAAPIPEVDWVARFREGFRPLRAAGFRIVPPWLLPASRARGRPSKPSRARILIIEPGRAFGTGTHETTRLCLRALESLADRAPIDRVLDLGTGTGILAVAAARLGCRRITALDIDPEAIQSARHHARLNAAEVTLVRGDGARPFVAAAFDLVLANVTAGLLVANAPEIVRLLAPNGAAVLSGLLQTDLPSVLAAYRGMGRIDVLDDGEWAAVVAARQP